MAEEKAVATQSAAGSRFSKAAKIYFKENLGIIVALLVLCIFLAVNPLTSSSLDRKSVV